MSRGVRDLRDLICVSRLTYRDSDTEDFESDEGELTPKDFDQLSLTSSGSDTPTKKEEEPIRVASPDSGFLTTESPTEPKNKTPTGSKPGSKKKRRKKLQTYPTRHELQRTEPLPPVSSNPETMSRFSVREKLNVANKKVNFDHMMCFMDASIVSGWLTRANDSVEHLAKFYNAEDNFVQFGHFWLSEFPDVQKQDIYELEFSILTEEIGLAFSVGIESRQITNRDVLDLVSALYREYPAKLLSSKGSHMLLDYLDIMSSERKDLYKKLLSDVRCSTKNRQYAQWLLAIRSFTLVNVWSAITNFYRNLKGQHKMLKCVPLPSSVSQQGVHQQRFYQAIRCGYIDVMHYLIVNGHVNPHQIDSHNRTWIFTAVMNNQPSAVKYLLHRVKPRIDVNVACDTGNTTLHAAANNGYSKLVAELITCSTLDIDPVNKQCENTTPLHLAVMHGHVKVVELLIKAGANTQLKMGDLTPLEIARDFQHDDIVKLFEDTGIESPIDETRI
ncbi:uncharacterized protein LOC126812105 [Patella vulgata]|uniref:uncharacterized protein LOC126812105 n=1 Tax=Patella vulgata TaxID=6465 RepID=UPI0021801556|nr:uncharacterized protein LOC126812105 [Patella vulgata]XP_055955007.1 uncharacterized protein LOC126812105 [Patella vulgata]